MAHTPGSFVECADESYEVQAIKGFIAGDLRIADLQASLGLSKSQTYKLVVRFKANGADGLTSRKAGNQNRAFDPERRAMILNLIREHYPDFGPTFALEKLEANHGITVGLETLRQWMKEEGVWIDRAGRKPRVFTSRQRRPRRGELIQVDGSYHRWFEKRGKEGCLLVFIDDATSEIMELRLVDTESSYNYMASLKRYIERFGCPQALYSDRHSIFRSPHENAEGERTTTQFARACMHLGINVICAKTPQAKGRVERSNRTLQDRLVKELRLRGISTFDEANAYLAEYRLAHNAQFAKPPADSEDAHSPSPNRNLNELLTYTVQRKVTKALSLSFNKMRIILEDSELSRRAIGAYVHVALHLDGSLEVLFNESALPFYLFDKIRRVEDEGPAVVDRKRLGAALAMAKAITEVEPHHFRRNAHVFAGFRKHFKEPDDLTSVKLRNAPEEIRNKHRGFPRQPLGRHPIIVLEKRINELNEGGGD